MKKLFTPLIVVLICATLATTAFAASSPTADSTTSSSSTTTSTTTDTTVEEEVVEEEVVETTTSTTTTTATEEEETVEETVTEASTTVTTEPVVNISEPLPVVTVAEIVPTVEYDVATLDEAIAEIIEEFVLTITELVVVVSDSTSTDSEATDGTTSDSATSDEEEPVMFAAEGTTQVGYDGTLYVFEEGLSSNLSAQAQEHVTAGQMVASFDLVLTHMTDDVVLSLPAGTVVSVEVSLSDDRNYAVLHDLGVTTTEVIDGVSTSVITYNGTNVELLDATYEDGQLSFAVNSSSPFAIIALPLELETKSPDTGVSLIDAMATVAP